MELKKIISQISSMLKNGIKPEQLLKALIDKGIPKDKATQFITMATQQNSGAPTQQYQMAGNVKPNMDTMIQTLTGGDQTKIPEVIRFLEENRPAEADPNYQYKGKTPGFKGSLAKFFRENIPAEADPNYMYEGNDLPGSEKNVIDFLNDMSPRGTVHNPDVNKTTAPFNAIGRMIIARNIKDNNYTTKQLKDMVLGKREPGYNREGIIIKDIIDTKGYSDMPINIDDIQMEKRSEEVKTPDFSKYKTFGEAFKNARKVLDKGKTFMWKGKEYGTLLKGEVPPAPKQEKEINEAIPPYMRGPIRRTNGMHKMPDGTLMRDDEMYQDGGYTSRPVPDFSNPEYAAEMNDPRAGYSEIWKNYYNNMPTKSGLFNLKGLEGIQGLVEGVSNYYQGIGSIGQEQKDKVAKAMFMMKEGGEIDNFELPEYVAGAVVTALPALMKMLPMLTGMMGDGQGEAEQLQTGSITPNLPNIGNRPETSLEAWAKTQSMTDPSQPQYMQPKPPQILPPVKPSGIPPELIDSLNKLGLPGAEYATRSMMGFNKFSDWLENRKWRKYQKAERLKTRNAGNSMNKNLAYNPNEVFGLGVTPNTGITDNRGLNMHKIIQDLGYGYSKFGGNIYENGGEVWIDESVADLLRKQGYEIEEINDCKECNKQ